MGLRPVGQHGRRYQEGVTSMSAIGEQAALLQREWQTRPRWAGITRDYSARDVIRLRGRAAVEHGPARRGATRLWGLLHSQDAVQAAACGNPAPPGSVARLKAGDQAAACGNPAQPAGTGPQAVYLPCWQPADGNLAGHTGPGQSPYPVMAGAEVVAGGAAGAFGLMKAMIEAGAAGVRFDDQLPAGSTRAHPGQRVLIPTGQHIEALTAARLAADVLGVPSLVIARTGARAASLLTSDSDERDHEFLTGERTAEGLHRVEPGLYACGTRALAFAPYVDLLWLETPAPDLAAARAFAAVIHSQYPGKLLAYSCSPAFGWQTTPDDAPAARFGKELAAMGYRFQVTSPLAEPADRAGRPARDEVPAYA